MKGVGRGSVSNIFLTHGCSCRPDAISKLTERTDSFTHHLHIFLVNGYRLRGVQHPTVQSITNGDLYPRFQRGGRDLVRVTVDWTCSKKALQHMRIHDTTSVTVRRFFLK